MAEVYNVVVGSNNQAISVSGYVLQLYIFWFYRRKFDFLRFRLTSRFSDFEFLSHKGEEYA